MYENTTFTKPGFLTNYLGKHSDELDLNEHDITSDDTRGYFTIANFLRKHGFPSYEEDYSEEAILERVRFKKLQQQVAAQHRKLGPENDYISNYKSDQMKDKAYLFSESLYGGRFQEIPRVEQKQVEVLQGSEVSLEEKIQFEFASDEQVAGGDAPTTSVHNPFYSRVQLTFWNKLKVNRLLVIHS